MAAERCACSRARVVESPVGRIFLASEKGALCGLWIESQRYFAQPCGLDELERMLGMQGVSDAASCEDDEVLACAEAWLARYFAGENPAIDFPLAPQGTAFRQEVWDVLLTIPYGELMTYGDIANLMAERRGIAKMSARAVGGAVGHNPISIIIPCHRVVGAGGNLTGYGGGLSIKQQLLRLEGVDMTPLYVPKKGTAL